MSGDGQVQLRPWTDARPGNAEGHLVLCIEDDLAQQEYLAELLQDLGYAVLRAVSGAKARAAVADVRPDAVLLDLGLPDIDGVELCRRLTFWPAAPIVVVTADFLEERIVAALDAGACDYVTKPFSEPVLAARLRAAIRDSDPTRHMPHGEVLRVGDVSLDTGTYELSIGGERVALPARPFTVLKHLMRHEGVLLPYSILSGKHRSDPVSGAEAQAVRIVISRLRKTLGEGPQRPRLVTEPRIGYRLVGPGGGA
ncbi:MAG TPA: response regulator transcription factor [Ilumatobacter sp.]|nr:response regulator transcription factor [Ilumatobacter sp.]